MNRYDISSKDIKLENHMKEKKPNFRDIKTFEEFSRYYWYKEELSKICCSLGLEYRCTKQELNRIIENYYNGNKIEKKPRKVNKKKLEFITLDTPLLECGFSLNKKFRELFSTITCIKPFKFNADMATAWRKVKTDNNLEFTIQDMINVYYGYSDYAKYDNSACQWNQFLKDFCADEFSNCYSNKLKVASILWKEVRDSKQDKKYTRKLIKKYEKKIEEYHNKKI